MSRMDAPREDTGRREAAAWALLLGLALALRLVGLGDRAFHHDESQVAYFAWSTITREHTYAYDPLLHGPWTYYATALAYAIGGVGDVTARLPAAVAGTVMVGLPYFLRAQLGRLAAFTAAAGLAVGPSYLYYSRFAREDLHIALITLAMVVIAARMLDAPRRWHPVALLALLAASFTVKESTLIFGFVVATYLVALLVAHRGRRPGRAPWTLTAARSVGWRPWALGLLAFAVVYVALFSSFGANWGGVWDGVYEGPSYWLGQHEVGRGGERWFFYLVLLVVYEPLALGLGLLGAGVVLRSWWWPRARITGFTDVISPRVRALTGYLVWGCAGSLAIYSWAGERFAWLVLHPLLLLLLLAGIGLQVLWAARASTLGRAGIVLAALAFAATAYNDVRVNVLHPEDPRELLITTQTSPEVPRAVERIRAADARLRATEGRRVTVAVDPGSGASYPWAWYLRELPVAYAAPSTPATDVLILTEDVSRRLEPRLDGYRRISVDLRVGWGRHYTGVGARDWWRWYWHRTPFTPLAPLREHVYVRRGL